jgi:hypothetical protein
VSRRAASTRTHRAVSSSSVTVTFLMNTSFVYHGFRVKGPDVHLGVVVWHLIEHDLHHGGEISQIPGTNRLPAPEI